jgi:hypothetical protein
MQVNQVRGWNVAATILSPPRVKSVCLGPKVLVMTSSNALSAATAALRHGDTILAVGPNSGSGKPLIARYIVILDQPNDASASTAYQQPTSHTSSGAVVDISNDRSVSEAMTKLEEAGVVIGDSSSEYIGAAGESRYDFAQELARLLPIFGSKLGDSYQSAPVPPDVPTEHPAAAAVRVVLGRGIMTLYPDGTFCGRRVMTRYECAEACHGICSKLSTAPKSNTVPVLSDVAPGSQDYDAVRFVVGIGAMAADPHGMFGGSRILTRNDAAIALAKLLEVARS